MSTHTDISIRFVGQVEPSLAALATVRDALARALAATGWGEEDAFRVLLCADEALANALTHGDIADGAIDVRFAVTPRNARLAVRDRHPVNALPASTVMPSVKDEHGRGLILMRALADRIRLRATRAGTSLGMAFRPAAVAS